MTVSLLSSAVLLKTGIDNTSVPVVKRMNSLQAGISLFRRNNLYNKSAHFIKIDKLKPGKPFQTFPGSVFLFMN